MHIDSADSAHQPWIYCLLLQSALVFIAVTHLEEFVALSYAVTKKKTKPKQCNSCNNSHHTQTQLAISIYLKGMWIIIVDSMTWHNWHKWVVYLCVASDAFLPNAPVVLSCTTHLCVTTCDRLVEMIKCFWIFGLGFFKCVFCVCEEHSAVPLNVVSHLCPVKKSVSLPVTHCFIR